MADIRRDFTKFVKDFPVEYIPHMSDEEMHERSEKHKRTMTNAIRRNPTKLPNIRSHASKNDLANVSTHTDAVARASKS